MHPSQPDTPGREPVEHSQQIDSKALVAICSELKLLLADVFAIYSAFSATKGSAAKSM